MAVVLFLVLPWIRVIEVIGEATRVEEEEAVFDRLTKKLYFAWEGQQCCWSKCRKKPVSLQRLATADRRDSEQPYRWQANYNLTPMQIIACRGHLHT